MPRVAPFVGLRYDPAVAGPITQLTAPPYDVISEPRRDGFHAASPYNVAHLDLATGSLDPDHEENRYARAAELLTDWERSGVLKADRQPGYDVYEMAWTDGAAGFSGSIRGILVALELEPWGGKIVPHEETMPGPIEDRLALLRATQTHLSPIYGTVAGPSAPLPASLTERVRRMLRSTSPTRRASDTGCGGSQALKRSPDGSSRTTC
jgi:uncharacterized protein (DUF1015 family)